MKTRIAVTSSKTLRELVQKELAEQGPLADLNHLDVSQLRDLDGVFERLQFLGDASQWNVSNVRTMRSTFKNAVIGADIETWDVYNVENTTDCFFSAYLTSDISRWYVKNITTANGMFRYAKLSINPTEWFMPHLQDASNMINESNLDIHRWVVGTSTYLTELWSSHHSTDKFFVLFPKARAESHDALKRVIENGYMHHAFKVENFTDMLHKRRIGWHHGAIRTLYPSICVHPDWTTQHDALLQLSRSLEPNMFEALNQFERSAIELDSPQMLSFQNLESLNSP